MEGGLTPFFFKEVVKMEYEYAKDIKKAAFEFISEIEPDIKKAIIDGEECIDDLYLDESGYGDIREYFTTEVTDQGCTLEDAAYIIANCNEKETDDGLWYNSDIEDAIRICAAYSRSNDVWAEVTSQYEALCDMFEPSWIVIDADGNEVETFSDEDEAEDSVKRNDPNGELGLEVTEGRGNIDEIWSEYISEHTVEPIETGGADELFVLKQWVNLAENAGTWGGYPLGSVYIDARCGIGYSMPNIKQFYDYDCEARLKLPSMVGKYIDDVKKRIIELEKALKKEWAVTVELEADQWGEIVTKLHEIARQIADGRNEGTGWVFTHNRRG